MIFCTCIYLYEIICIALVANITLSRLKGLSFEVRFAMDPGNRKKEWETCWDDLDMTGQIWIMALELLIVADEHQWLSKEPSKAKEFSLEETQEPSYI